MWEIIAMCMCVCVYVLIEWLALFWLPRSNSHFLLIKAFPMWGITFPSLCFLFFKSTTVSYFFLAKRRAYGPSQFNYDLYLSLEFVNSNTEVWRQRFKKISQGWVILWRNSCLAYAPGSLGPPKGSTVLFYFKSVSHIISFQWISFLTYRSRVTLFLSKTAYLT